MLPVAPTSPNQRPGSATTDTPLHVHAKGSRMIVPNVHACKQDTTRAQVQAPPQLDVAVCWQDTVETTSGFESRSAVDSIAAVDIRGTHCVSTALFHIPCAKRLKVIHQVSKLSIEVCIVVPDNPSTERDVIGIGCETPQETRQPGI